MSLILLVIEAKDGAAFIAKALRSRSYEVVVTDSVERACAVANERTVDIAITSLALADGSGFTLARRMSRGGDTILFALCDVEVDGDRLAAAGFHRWFARPFDANAIVAAVDASASAA